MKNGRGGEKRGEAKKAFAAQENSQANQYGDIASTKGTIMKNAKLMKKVANFGVAWENDFGYVQAIQVKDTI